MKTLQYIATPYATFTPEKNGDELIWEENTVFSFRFKLFSLLPLETHTIKVISFSEDCGIYTHEKNPYVPIWNHRIILKQLDQSATQ